MSVLKPEENILKKNTNIHKFEKIESKSGPFLSVILGLIILLCCLTLTILGIMTLPGKAKQISKLRSQLITNAMSSQDIALLKQAVETTQDDREKLQAAFPNEATLLEFYNLIDGLKNDEVGVAKFSVDSDIPTKIGKNPSFLPMTLVLRGKPKAVQEAMLKITQSPYFIRPVTISYSSDQSGSNVEIKSSFHLYVSEPYAKKN